MESKLKTMEDIKKLFKGKYIECEDHELDNGPSPWGKGVGHDDKYAQGYREGYIAGKEVGLEILAKVESMRANPPMMVHLDHSDDLVKMLEKDHPKLQYIGVDTGVTPSITKKETWVFDGATEKYRLATPKEKEEFELWLESQR